MSDKVVSSPNVESHDARKRAARAISSRGAAEGLHAAVTDHSSMQAVADELGVSKSTIRDWCDPESGKSIAAPDIWRLPPSVRRAYARMLLASTDGDAVAVARERQSAALAEIGKAAMEAMEKSGLRVAR